MSELTIARTQEQRMTSIEVAELTGKRHDNVARDIKSLIDQGAINALNFEEIAYTDSRNRVQSMYSLDFKTNSKPRTATSTRQPPKAQSSRFSSIPASATATARQSIN